MKMAVLYKHLGVAALTLGIAVGCATTQQPQAQQDQTCDPELVDEVNASIQEATTSLREARNMGADTGEAADLIASAKTARDDCRIGDALADAQEAKTAATDAIAAYKQRQQEMKQQQAKPQKTQPQRKKDRSYTVSRGDTLWGISGSSVGYNDPYQWPLIYRENAEKIEDPDLIYPGQEFMIEAYPTDSEVEAAVEHAKTRGAWELGEVEESDQEYLDSQM
jgi:nucleoid-associated protein YgaU